MDYVVGSVAALISGNVNVTPDRPRLTKRALTPKKHQISPNVTPKSELVLDRSILLSPSLQRKKAIVKKSPKRIFQNPELDVTNDGEGTSATSPKPDKVKKHLKNDLEADPVPNSSLKSPKSPKGKHNTSLKSESPKKKLKIESKVDTEENVQVSNENTPKKKKQRISILEASGTFEIDEKENLQSKHNTSLKSDSLKKKSSVNRDEETIEENAQVSNESSPKRKKKQRNSIVEASGTFVIEENDNLPSDTPVMNIANNAVKSPKKKKNRKLISESTGNIEVEDIINNDEKDIDAKNDTSKEKIGKKPKKSKSLDSLDSVQRESPNKQNQTDIQVTMETQANQQKSKKKNRRKKKSKSQNPIETTTEHILNQEPKTDILASKSLQMKKKNIKMNAANKESDSENDSDDEMDPPKMEKKRIVNQNAITNKDSDSEHESDDDIGSETEQINKEILDTGPLEESSDEEEDKKPQKEEHPETYSEEEIKRTLFVGNVPFSTKIKKDMKKIFSKYGHIDTVRVRTVPVKDARFTPKLAVIRNELHPDRTTVNVYVKYSDSSSVEKALVENNTVYNSNHLRVTKSDTTGAEHDSRCAVFVGNLPFGIEDEAFRKVFERCGEVHSVRIVRDKKTNAGKGFGYVNFASKDGVELALAMTEEDLTVKNKILRVKRCSQNPRKQSKNINNNDQGIQERNQSFQGRNRGGFQGRNQGFQERNQGGFQGRNQGFQGRNQGDVRGRGRGGFRGSNRGGFQGRNQGFQDRSQGDDRGRDQGGFQGRSRGSFQGRNQGGFQGRNQDSFQGRGGFGRQDGGQNTNFAERRVMNKRKSQEGGEGDGPPIKRPNNDQPTREKKERKEFVGMTAEKKKKHKVNKGQKKKKALSEILSK